MAEGEKYLCRSIASSHRAGQKHNDGSEWHVGQVSAIAVTDPSNCATEVVFLLAFRDGRIERQSGVVDGSIFCKVFCEDIRTHLFILPFPVFLQEEADAVVIVAADDDNGGALAEVGRKGECNYSICL